MEHVGGRTTVRLLNSRWVYKYARHYEEHASILPLEDNVTLVATRTEGRDFGILAQWLADKVRWGYGLGTLRLRDPMIKGP